MEPTNESNQIIKDVTKNAAKEDNSDGKTLLSLQCKSILIQKYMVKKRGATS